MLGRWLAVLAVLALVGLGAVSRVDRWPFAPDDRSLEPTNVRPEADSTSSNSEHPSSAATSQTGQPSGRRADPELQARIRRLERELADSGGDEPVVEAIAATHARPPFDANITRDARPARFLAYDQMTSLEQAESQPAELILQLADGGVGRIRLAGHPPSRPLNEELRKLAEALLLNRYDLDLVTDAFVAVEIDRGHYQPFADDVEAAEHARRVFDNQAWEYAIELSEDEYRVVDLRPLHREREFLDLEDEFRRLADEAKRVDPRVIEPVLSLSW